MVFETYSVSQRIDQTFQTRFESRAGVRWVLTLGLMGFSGSFQHLWFKITWSYYVALDVTQRPQH